MRRLQAAALLLPLLAVSGCGAGIPTAGATSSSPAASTAAGTQGAPPALDWRQSQWSIGDLEVKPPEVRAGQTVELTANIYVPGIVERYGRAYFLVGGRTVAEVDNILIYGDEIIPVRGAFIPTQPGTYEVRFNVVLLESGPAVTRQDDLVAYLTVSS